MVRAIEPLPIAVHVLESVQEMPNEGLNGQKLNAQVAPPSVV